MTAPARRRLVALGLLLVAGTAGAVWARGGPDAPRSAGPLVDVSHASGRLGGQLPAAARRPRLAVPRRVEGDGPFLTVEDGAVRRAPARARAGRVALTFDDGPGPLTWRILRELERLDARATFFVLGEHVRERPETVLALRDAGMVVANHSWSHPALARLPARRQAAEIGRTQSELARLLGVRPRFFRPPLWSWDRRTAREAAARGLVGVLFDVDAQDWRRDGTRAIVRRALRARPGDVIALHDAGGDHAATLRAVAPIVRGLRARGLEPVTLDELWPAD